ncbi:unnamed protein product, partial [Heterobilharzia americana]
MKFLLPLNVITLIFLVPFGLCVPYSDENVYFYVVRSPKIEKRIHTEDETLSHYKEKTKIDTSSKTSVKTTNGSSLSPSLFKNKFYTGSSEKPNTTANSESLSQDKNSVKYEKVIKNRREISEVIKHIPKSNGK